MTAQAISRVIRPAALVGLLAILAIGALAPAAAAEEKQTERVDRTIPFAPGGTLKLKNFSGDIRINGSHQGEVVIAAVRRATRERLDTIKLDIRVDGNEIIIDANKRDDGWRNRDNNVVETEFDISLPADTRLDVDAFSSGVRIEGVTGRQKVHTFSGEIDVRGAAAPLELQTFSGDVEFQLTDAGASADLQIETFSGSIRAHMPETATGTVRFNSFSGGLKSDLPLTLESGDRRNLRGRLNNGSGGDLYFKTFSGDVRITR